MDKYDACRFNCIFCVSACEGLQLVEEFFIGLRVGKVDAQTLEAFGLQAQARSQGMAAAVAQR